MTSSVYLDEAESVPTHSSYKDILSHGARPKTTPKTPSWTPLEAPLNQKHIETNKTLSAEKNPQELHQKMLELQSSELHETQAIFPQLLLVPLHCLDLEDWKKLASHLKLDTFIDSIEWTVRNHGKSPTMLLMHKWWQSHGRNADMDEIKDALKKIGRIDVLDDFIDAQVKWETIIADNLSHSARPKTTAKTPSQTPLGAPMNQMHNKTNQNPSVEKNPQELHQKMSELQNPLIVPSDPAPSSTTAGQPGMIMVPFHNLNVEVVPMRRDHLSLDPYRYSTMS